MLHTTRNSAASLLLLAALTACSQHASGQRPSLQQRVSEKRVNPARTSTPSIMTQNGKTATVSAPTPAWREAVAPSAVPTSEPLAHVVIPTLSPDAPPRIVSIHLVSRVVTPGQTVVGSVTASSNVASVELRIGGYSSTMQKVGVGRFTLAFTVPQLPSFLLGRTYELEIIARNTRGDSVDQQLPIVVQ